MIRKTPFFRKFSAVPDLIIILLIGTLIYGLVAISQQWQAEFKPVTQINLSIWSLPKYTLFSGIRGFVAYGLSLAFTIVVGYCAAHFKRAERILIPLLDILQSIPVLGFLPALLIGLVALFPHSNTGIELAAVIMIFTGQVWNMTFSFYSSLKSVPTDFNEAATVIGLSWKQKLIKVELPYSAVGLTWNSVMSMAGGWFFLSACEAMKLGESDYRIPGVGSYMAVATEQGDTRAMVAGVVAMIVLIVAIDFFLWRPMLAWIQRFRLEDIPGAAPEEPLAQVMLRESRLMRWLRLQYRRIQFEQTHQANQAQSLESQAGKLKSPKKPLPSSTGVSSANVSEPASAPLVETPAQVFRRRSSGFKKFLIKRADWFGRLATAGVFFIIIFYGWHLVQMLSVLNSTDWVVLFRNTFWSMVRVFTSVLLSTIWTVPFGIWVGISNRRIRFFQPIIQLMASFPAPMLYPIMVMALFWLGFNFDVTSMFLMLFGVQWYVLFNVLAGALRIPHQLMDALELMDASTWNRWKTLYLPSVFPSLVTGWVTAAGGAWNATILAEYLPYKGKTLITSGLGASISAAVDAKNFPMLGAALTIMVAMVILLNQVVWARIYHLAQTRYRMDL